jgi:DNA-binding NarL/FixJ family response regulator
VRVVIADDSVLLREGLARVLAESGFEVVAQAANADELRQAVRRYKPDVAIVDVRMPPTHTDEGARAALEIREEQPEVAVLVLSQVIEAAHAVRLFSERPEGFGYLLKDRVLEIDDFLEAVRRVGRGGTAIDPEVIGQLVGRRTDDGPLEELTPREREVLELMAQGLSNRGICEKLVVSPKTVETHVSSIFLKPGSCPCRTSTAVCWRCSHSSARSVRGALAAQPAIVSATRAREAFPRVSRTATSMTYEPGRRSISRVR